MSPERSGLLKSFLGSLPEPIAARLAQAVEMDRLAEGKALPHEMILEGLRPVLRRTSTSDRTPTPLRMFCMPFEDLLSSLPRSEKQKGRIARTSVGPVWNWLGQFVLPDETRAYAREFRELTVVGQHGEARARAAVFWKQASDAIRSALSDPPRRASALAQFGSELVIGDAEEMATLLLVGDAVVEIQEKMPRFVPAMTEDVLWHLHAIYDRIVLEAGEAAPYVAVVAMNRLSRPWEALKFAQHICHQTQDTLISSTDMGLVGEIIFGDIEAHKNAVNDARHPNFDAEALVDHLSHFTNLSSGIVKGIDIRRDGKWGQRLLKGRAQVAETMDAFMERASKELAGALPMTRLGNSANGPRVPDFAHKIDAERHDRATRYVRLVTGCRNFAVAASFGASQKKAEDDLCQLLEVYTEDVLKALRSEHGESRVVVESQFEFVTALTYFLFGEEAADLLRRRGRAALAAQVAA